MRSPRGLVRSALATLLPVGLLAGILLSPAGALAQKPPDRPFLRPVDPPLAYERAVEAGTRSGDGSPGPEYWQQWTEYEIEARLEPEAKRVENVTRIRYHNRSPDRLPVLFVHLHQNLHAEGAVRNEPQEVTGGVEVVRVSVGGQELARDPAERPGWTVDGTRMAIALPEPLPPGGTVELEIASGFRIPRSGAGRMGWDGDDLFFVAYWYPQMAVYDDVRGWQNDPYLGRAEFYMGFADYRVELDLPEGWVVRATGELRNPEEVFTAPVRERLARADRSDSVVHVLTAADFGPGGSTVDAPDDRLRWVFEADSVRDFAFSATRRSLWDAARTPVGDLDGDGEPEHTRVEALYREDASRWTETWRYARHAIDFLSRHTGLPYPWPHMTAIEGGGIIGGGMEFPMMTLMGDYQTRGDSALYYVTAHELAHMWVPMIVGTDEKRYAWMDEGTITFHENRARDEFYPGPDHDGADRRDYLEVARRGDGEPIMRWMDYQLPEAGNVPNYDKPAVALVILREVLGREVFREAMSTFLREWSYRHPLPWDFFRTVSRVADRDMDWFWRSWYLETWTLDHAVGRVRSRDRRWEITVEDRGNAIAPAILQVKLEEGLTLTRQVQAKAWISGDRQTTVEVPTADRIVEIVLDPAGVLPDVDRSNNRWSRDDGGEEDDDEDGEEE